MQELSLVKKVLIGVTKTDDPISVEEIVRISKDIDHSAQEIRNISHELMPFALKEIGLVTALEDLLAKV